MFNLAKPKVLVIGGSGTVGSSVVRAFADSGEYELHCVCRKSPSEREDVSTHLFDIRADKLSTKLAGLDFDYIIDCAQPRYVQGDDVDFGVEHIKDIEALCSKLTKRLIYTSGVWIYGDQPNGQRISEKSSLAPLSPAATRVPVLRHIAASAFPWVQLCLPSIVYGTQGPLQEIVQKASKDELESISDRSVLWSVVEQSDLGQAYLAAVSKQLNYSLYCIAEPNSVPVVDFFETLEKILGKTISKKTSRELEAKWSEEELEVAFASQSVDGSLFRSETGWKPRHSCLKDLRKFVASGGTKKRGQSLMF